MYKSSFFRFLGGFAGLFVSDTYFAFTLFTRSSDISAAIPSTVALGTINVSPLKFANMMYDRSARRRALGLDCVFTYEDCSALGSMCVRARTGKIPSIDIWTGSTTKGGGSDRLPFPVFLVLPVCTGVRVRSTCHDLACGVVASLREFAGFCSSVWLASCCGVWGMRSSLPYVKTVSAALSSFASSRLRCSRFSLGSAAHCSRSL